MFHACNILQPDNITAGKMKFINYILTIKAAFVNLSTLK